MKPRFMKPEAGQTPCRGQISRPRPAILYPSQAGSSWSPVTIVAPVAFDFGMVRVRQTVSETVTIGNTGGGSLSVSSIPLLGERGHLLPNQ